MSKTGVVAIVTCILMTIGRMAAGGDSVPERKQAENASDKAHTAYSRGELDEALDLWLAYLESLQDPESAEWGRTLEWIVRSNERLDRPDAARKYAADWVQWARTTGNDSELTRAISAQAQAAEELGRMDEALRLRREAVEIAQSSWASGPAVALARLRLAEALKAEGIYADAEVQYGEALKNLEDNPHAIENSWILESYADLLDRTGRMGEAQSARIRAATIETEADAEMDASGKWEYTPN